MSRDSLLDDAIEEAKRIEDWQLVEWLRMARGGESAARWYTERLQAYKSQCAVLAVENAELRELCKAALACAEHGNCDECRVTFGGCTLRTAMRELVVEVDE